MGRPVNIYGQDCSKYEKVAAGSITRLAGNKRVHRFKHGIQGYQI